MAFNSRSPPPVTRHRDHLVNDPNAAKEARHASLGVIGPPPPTALPKLPPADLPAPIADVSYRQASHTSGPGHSQTDTDPASRYEAAHPYAQAASSSTASGSRRERPESQASLYASALVETPRSATNAPAATTSSTHSKSVLTVALAKANAAVELDEANDIAGAIAAYSESVRLLRDVMVRVEQQSSSWIAKERDRLAMRSSDLSETESDRQDRERREERIQRRERARVEDIRRLRDIHDTYEERITMLAALPAQQMGTGSEAKGKRLSLSPPLTPRTPPAVYEVQAPPVSPRRSSLQTFSPEVQQFAGDQEGVPGVAALSLTSSAGDGGGDGGGFGEGQPGGVRDPRHATRPSLASLNEMPKKRLSRQSISSIISESAPPIVLERKSSARRHMQRASGLSTASSHTEIAAPRGARQQHLSKGSLQSDFSGDSIVPVTAREHGSDWPTDGAPAGISPAALDSGRMDDVTTTLGSHMRPAPQEPRPVAATSVHGGVPKTDATNDYTRAQSAAPQPFPSHGEGYTEPSTSPSSPSKAVDPLLKRIRALSQPGKRPLSASATDRFLDRSSQEPASAVRLNGSRQVSAPVPAFAVRPPSLPPTPSSAIDTLNSKDSPVTSLDSSAVGTPLSGGFSRANGAHAGLTSSLQTPRIMSLSSVPITRRPFEQLRRLHLSITDGAFLSARLFIPPTAWTVAGVKLNSVETKIRMLEVLISGLEGVNRASDLDQSANTTSGVENLFKELDNFDGLLDGLHSTLGKKLGFADGFRGGKKSGTNSISTFSSKLSKSFDRITNAKSLDAPAMYVETLSRLFLHAQIIDQHLALLSGDHSAANGVPASFYDAVHGDLKAQIEARLRRASDFFGSVVCPLVLGDVGMLLDKHVKLASRWTLE